MIFPKYLDPQFFINLGWDLIFDVNPGRFGKI